MKKQIVKSVRFDESQLPSGLELQYYVWMSRLIKGREPECEIFSHNVPFRSIKKVNTWLRNYGNIPGMCGYVVKLYLLRDEQQVDSRLLANEVYDPAPWPSRKNR